MTQAPVEVRREFTSSCQRPSQHFCRLLGTKSGVGPPRCHIPGVVLEMPPGFHWSWVTLCSSLCSTSAPVRCCPTSPSGIESSRSGLAFLGRHAEYYCTAKGKVVCSTPGAVGMWSGLHSHWASPCSGLPITGGSGAVSPVPSPSVSLVVSAGVSGIPRAPLWPLFPGRLLSPL